VQAVNHACQQTGYSLLLADSGNNEEREVALLENMLTQYIDGLLVIHSGKLQHHSLLDAPPHPIVFVDREVEGRACVITDNYSGGRLAARYLVGAGHRHIGMLIGDAHVKNVQQRVAGFADELASHGLCVAPNLMIYGSQSLDTGRDVHFLMLADQPPTAIFATNDIIALGAWHKLSEMGVRIPEDVSLVGFDNIDMSQWTVPALTTVSQDKHELGRQSVMTLIRAIQTKTSIAHTIHVAPSLIVRNSTGPITKVS
jgi:LacI family transcriptional regulator